MGKDSISVEEIFLVAQGSINDFPINGKFLIKSIIEKTTRYNKPYFSLELKDKTGNLNAKRFTRDKSEFELLKSIYKEGKVIEVEAVYQNEWNSVKINSERVLEPEEYDSKDYEESSDIDLDRLISTLIYTLDSIQNKYLKKLLTIIFEEEEIRNLYYECPASVGLHHSYKHGILEHTVSMIKIFQTLEENYEKNYKLDKDLVYTGIILHDVGKIKEYLIENGIATRNPGFGLIGHISLGEELVVKFIKPISNFPEELECKIRHLILSHHGKREFGSPVEPQIPEAEILHLIDNLDAKYNEEP